LGFAAIGIAATATALGWALYRWGEVREERSALHSAMHVLCAKAVVNDVYLAEATRKMRKVVGEKVADGIQGSLEVLGPEKDGKIRELFGDRDLGSAPLGSDPKDAERLMTVYETIAKTDAKLIGLCDAMTTAIEPCMPGITWRTDFSDARRTCVQESFKKPLKELNDYLMRNVRLDPKYATPRE
jgi:hypothetical protein